MGRLRDTEATTSFAIDSREVGGRFYKSHLDLAIQLALDPGIEAVRYVASLPLFDQIVPIHMIAADASDGPVAFDIVDGRQDRDLDDDGLLLLALQHHAIRLAETDFETIEAEPYASNCRMVWRYRDHPVDASLADAIDRAIIDRQAPTVREVGRMVGLRHPMATVCALICRKRIHADLGEERFDLHSVVRRPEPTVRAAIGVGSEPGIVGEYGEPK